MIPSTIKSGMNNELNVLEKKEIEINTKALIMSFTEYAMRRASIYVEHSGRKTVQVNDIKKSMMVEVFKYFTHIDLQENIEQWRRDIIEDEMLSESDSQEEEEEDENDENNSSQHSTHACQCDNCEMMNTIEESWKYYEPENDLGHILKKHIDNMPSID